MTNTNQMSRINVWKYIKVDPESVKNNPYLQPDKEEPAAEVKPTKRKKTKRTVSTPITSLDDYLRLENLVCKDVDGNIFEEYPELYVRKDVERNDQKQIMYFTPYNSVAHFEAKNNGEFQPSFALTCAIVANLYHNKQDTAVKQVLDQYNNYGPGYGYHTQNTLIDFEAEKIIHYPSEKDSGQTTAVNSARTKRELPFSKSTLQNSLLQDALGDSASARYVQQLTGLSNPAILIAISTYFGKPANLWFPWSGQGGAKYIDKRGAWFGCRGSNLDLNSSYYLNNYDASRGVCR